MFDFLINNPHKLNTCSVDENDETFSIISTLMQRVLKWLIEVFKQVVTLAFDVFRREFSGT